MNFDPTDQVKEGDKIVVWVSNGAASAVAAKKTQEKFGNFCSIRYVLNPVFNEHPDNFRFMKDLGTWLNAEIEFATNRKYPSCNIEEVFEKRKYMSGVDGAVCTTELKIKARQQWEEKNDFDWLVMGYTADELHRHKNFTFERSNVLPILINAGLTKEDCFQIIAAAGVKVSDVYTMKSRFADGYPNGNCIGCVKSRSPTYWNHVRETVPAVFKSRAEQSRRLGVRLIEVHPKYLKYCKKDSSGIWWNMVTGEQITKVTGTRKKSVVRIFLDELDPDLKTGDLKTYDMPDCGIFCKGVDLYNPDGTVKK